MWEDNAAQKEEKQQNNANENAEEEDRFPANVPDGNVLTHTSCVPPPSKKNKNRTIGAEKKQNNVNANEEGERFLANESYTSSVLPPSQKNSNRRISDYGTNDDTIRASSVSSYSSSSIPSILPYTMDLKKKLTKKKEFCHSVCSFLLCVIFVLVVMACVVLFVVCSQSKDCASKFRPIDDDEPVEETPTALPIVQLNNDTLLLPMEKKTIERNCFDCSRARSVRLLSYLRKNDPDGELCCFDSGKDIYDAMYTMISYQAGVMKEICQAEECYHRIFFQLRGHVSKFNNTGILLFHDPEILQQSDARFTVTHHNGTRIVIHTGGYYEVHTRIYYRLRLDKGKPPFAIGHQVRHISMGYETPIDSVSTYCETTFATEHPLTMMFIHHFKDNDVIYVRTYNMDSLELVDTTMSASVLSIASV